MRELVLIAMIGLAGACFGSKPAPAPAAVPANSVALDCASAAGALVRALATEEAKDEVPDVTAAVTKRCNADKWTAEAVTCFGRVRDDESVKQCGYNHLTQAQQDKVDKPLEPLSAWSVSRSMKKMAEFTDKMCACQDYNCAMRVSDEMTAWSQQMAKQTREPARWTEEQTKQAAEIGERMGKCMQTAMMAGQPPLPPPPPLSVSGLEPTNGNADGGTYVVIRGESFTADGARNVKVYFGKTQASVVRFASDTELVVEAPAGKAKQTVDVVLQFDPGGEKKLAKAFTFVKKK